MSVERLQLWHCSYHGLRFTGPTCNGPLCSGQCEPVEAVVLPDVGEPTVIEPTTGWEDGSNEWLVGIVDDVSARPWVDINPRHYSPDECERVAAALVAAARLARDAGGAQ